MRYSKIEQALETVLPGAVYKVQAPEHAPDGSPLTRFLVSFFQTFKVFGR